MNKSTLKAEFINAKIKDAKYIGVSIKTEGSSQPEIIINPRENFDAKFDYYMEAYDDDLILIAAKGKKDIRIVAAGHGNRFEDIENQLIGEKGNWKRGAMQQHGQRNRELRQKSGKFSTIYTFTVCKKWRTESHE